MNPSNISRGFTLVESIIVLVVLAIAAAAISTMSGGIFKGQDENKDLQIGMQLMQECAEQVLANHRAATATPAPTPDCSNLATYAGITLPSPFPATAAFAGTACPTGKTCKLVTISVTAGGSNLTPINLMLVDP